MPSFCRHNRLIQNCPICSREQSIEARPLVSSAAPRASQARPAPTPAPGGTRRRSPSGASGGVRVRRLERGQDDGYRSPLVPGIKSSAEAERLAEELAFAAARLSLLGDEPPGLYAQVAAAGEIEERTWLAVLIAWLGPLEGPEPFAEIERVRVPWASGDLPDLSGVSGGPRGVQETGGAGRTLAAYRAWAQRGGGQAVAFSGDAAWSPERRFARLFERLALPGLHRDARYELLVSLGRLGLYPVEPATLALGGENAVTHAAKRALGIGDPLLLDRRAQALSEAAGLPLAALDLGLHNWERRERVRAGAPAELEADPERVAVVQSALGL